jgi:hypothetical protein
MGGGETWTEIDRRANGFMARLTAFNVVEVAADAADAALDAMAQSVVSRELLKVVKLDLNFLEV